MLFAISKRQLRIVISWCVWNLPNVSSIAGFVNSISSGFSSESGVPLSKILARFSSAKFKFAKRVSINVLSSRGK